MGLRTVDIIQDLVENWDINLTINSVETIGDAYKLSVCNTWYLNEKSSNKITINGVEYLITEVVLNDYLIVKGPSMPIIGVYSLPKLKFYHGSIIQTNVELKQESNVYAKTPMVYLNRPFQETQNHKDQLYDRVSDITLYFLNQSNYDHWRTFEQDKYSVIPMSNIRESFIEYLQNDNRIGVLETSQQNDKLRFGVTISNNGVEKSFWDDYLSGVQLDLSLPIRRDNKCKC